MNKKIFVLYDTTRKKCDKIWVAEGLEKEGFWVRTLYCPCVIFALEQRGKVGKIIALILITLQCIMAALLTRKQDVIFCWNHWTGLIMNLLFGKVRRIVSYNWLTPQDAPKSVWLYKKALENPNLQAVINSKDNRDKLLKKYDAKDIDNIFYIPDVYDNLISFKQPSPAFKDGYCFMGGVENRDWETFLKIAQECPEISFVGVTSKNQEIKEVDIPSNVKMFYDLSMDRYYEIMSKAGCCICFLKEDRVSGLINILKAAQFGKIMLITKSKFTEMYFPNQMDCFLLDREDRKQALYTLRSVYKMPVQQYEQVVSVWQEYIKMEYSPDRAIRDLKLIIERG